MVTVEVEKSGVSQEETQLSDEKYQDYCGNCLMLVTRSPMKRTKTVFEGGWP